MDRTSQSVHAKNRLEGELYRARYVRHHVTALVTVSPNDRTNESRFLEKKTGLCVLRDLFE